MFLMTNQFILDDLSNNKIRYKTKLTIKAKQQKAYFSPNRIMQSAQVQKEQVVFAYFFFFFFADSLYRLPAISETKHCWVGWFYFWGVVFTATVDCILPPGLRF